MGVLVKVKHEGVIMLNEPARQRAANLSGLGIKPLDALHLALAESGQADYFCTCDDKLLRHAQKIKDLSVTVINPVDLVQEIEQ